MKRYVGIGLITILALAFAGPAAAQDYPPEVLGEVAVSDSTVVCGAQSIEVTGDAWEPGTEVEIQFDGDPIATVTPDGTGSFATTVDVPDASLGNHVLRAVQQSETAGTVEGQATITCVEATALAGTGASIATWVFLAAGLLIAGGAMIVVGRRRRVSA